MIHSNGSSGSYTGATQFAPGRVLGGRFVVERAIYYGRVGIAYRALDRALSVGGRPRHVALVIVPPYFASSEQARVSLERDVAQVRSLAHRNLVKLLGFHRDGDVHFLAMDYVDGQPLRKIAGALQPEPLMRDEAMEVVAAVGAVLAHAHSRNVAHGDVCLDNVLVGEDGEIRVLFTVACFANPTGAFSVRDDLYRLASMAYELLSGTPLSRALFGHRPGRRATEPKRVPRLSRREWRALRAVLTRRQGPMTVADFLEELGLGGAVTGRASRHVRGSPATPRPRTAGAHGVRRFEWRLVAVSWVVFLGLAYFLTRSPVVETPASAPASTSTAREQAIVDPAEERGSGEAAGPERGEREVAADDRPAGERAVDADGVEGVTVLSRPAAAQRLAVDGRIVPAEQPVAAAAGFAEPLPASSIVSFATAAVTASERDGIVSLEIRRTGAHDPASVVWWTVEASARADDDFASLGAVVETFARDEMSRTITIPIVSDRVAEDRESFHVYLREGSVGNVRLGPVSRSTITIIDDDV